MLSDTVQKMAERSVLCWLATCDESGQPNVSPKEIFAVLDNEHLVIANIASPKSAENIHHNPRVCVSFIDIFVQKGFKVQGIATEIKPSQPTYSHWAEPLSSMVGERFTIRSIFVVQATAVEQILAPSYRFYPAETSEETQIQSALRTYGVATR